MARFLGFEVNWTDGFRHICSDLAMREDSAIGIRLDQLPIAARKLERAMAKQPSPPPYDNMDTSHHYRLKETAEKVLTNANSVASAANTSYADSIRDFSSLSLNGRSLGHEERFGIEKWIKELQAVEDEDKSEPVEPRLKSMLPEVMLSTPAPIAISTEESRISASASTETDYTPEHVIDDEDADDFEQDFVNRLIAEGKKHFQNDNRAQAADHLTRALGRADQFSKASYKSIDLTETRSILATLLIQERELDEAEQYLLALLGESTPSEQNNRFICQAHYQLARLYLMRKGYEDARSHCQKAINGRARLDGKKSEPYFRAVQLLTVISSGTGSDPETEVLLKMLPEDMREETRRQIHGANRAVVFDSSPLPQSQGSGSRIGPLAPSKRRHYSNADSAMDEHSSANINESAIPSSSANGGPGSIRVRATSTITDRDTCVAQLAQAGYSGDFNASQALSWAIKHGRVRIVHFLLEGYPVIRPKRRFSRKLEDDQITKQVDPNGSSKDKAKPLMLAISSKQVLIVKLLLERGARLTIKDEKGRTPLVKAVEVGNTEVIKLLLEKEVPIQSQGAWSPWHEAAQQGHAHVLRLFLKRGANIDAQDGAGATALKIAAALGHRDACSLLIDELAVIDIPAKDGWTPLISSIRNGHTAVTEILIRHHASVNQQNGKQQTPLSVAACEGRVEEARMLLEYHANLEKADDRGYTPLMTASREGHVEIVQLLLQAGANANAYCHRKSTALDQASRSKYRNIEKFLKDAGGTRGSKLTEPHIQVNDAFKGYIVV